MPALYIVATPIGNLEDISRRALRILGEVSLIAAEDTRRTRRLLVKYNINTPTTSYHQHNKWSKLNYILDQLGHSDVALVANAGTPGMSDPGYELIVAASQRGIPVIPIPGASVIITALVVSGLPPDRFSYLGFLPRRRGQRRQYLSTVADDPATLIVLEAPHRMLPSLQDIRQVLGDRRLAVCRELTKRHEEVFRGTVSQALAHFTAPRGEFTLVIEGQRQPEKPQLTIDIKQRLGDMKRSGITAKEAVAHIAGETGLTRRELYHAWLRQDDT